MKKLHELAKNLKNKGYLVECFETKEEAAAYLNEQLDHQVIGIGGSQTVRQMGLYPALASHNTVYWHDNMTDKQAIKETRQAAFRAPVYISSVNAISMNGEIVNIDGTGNRVAAMTFGPDDVYFVVGSNKIAEDSEAAMYRARNVAAPLNAKRLNRKTPCAANGDRCYDCNSPERICRVFSVFKEPPMGPTYHVILINESLGY